MLNISNLVENEKYTLLIENEYGLIISRKIRFKKAMFESYAQFDKTLVLHFVEKNKRHIAGARFIDNKLVIAEGWIDIKGTFEDKNKDKRTYEYMICDFNATEFNQVVDSNNLKIAYQYN